LPPAATKEGPQATVDLVGHPDLGIGVDAKVAEHPPERHLLGSKTKLMPNDANTPGNASETLPVVQVVLGPGVAVPRVSSFSSRAVSGSPARL